MNCPKCGWNNADGAAKCVNCFAELVPPQQPYAQPPTQQPYAQQPYAQQQYAAPQPVLNVQDHMVWSIVATVLAFLFCWCLPVPIAFGIVAIVKCSQANNKKLAGDYFGAQQAANTAKTWLFWTLGLDAAGLIGWIICVLIIVMGSASKSQF